MWNWIQYTGSLFLGWSLGANDSANIFGTAVSSRMVSYKLAICLTAIFVILGAILQGEAGIRTYSEKLRKKHSINASSAVAEKKAISEAKQVAMIVSFAAALAVTGMTILKLPVSTSQAVVGAIIGVGIMQHDVDLGGLGKVVACWIGTPIGAAILTFIFYYTFRFLLKKWNPSAFVYDPVISLLLILCGCYGAYALGANNVANVSAIFVGKGMLTVQQAAIFGGITIALGVLTYSRPVMMTVGKGIVKLDSFTAFVCVLSHALTVHIYAIVGVPVSTSQAIVGAVLGISFIRGAHTVNYRMLAKVSSGWIATPFISGVLSSLGYFIANLRYMPQ